MVIKTAESVTEGHPDKVCDQISDALLDAYVREDPNARCAIETMATGKKVIVGGEVKSTATVDIPFIVKQTLKEIGYTDEKFGLNYKDVEVDIYVHQQSPEIAQGVDVNGAGDQGVMYGFACTETDALLPLPIYLAHQLTKRLAYVRKKNIIPNLGPDGKSQVSIDYETKKATNVIIAQQHTKDISEETLRAQIIEHVIDVVLHEYLDEQTKIIINGTGSFLVGGPGVDCGLTGRKIIVDTYGGLAHHGGGAFSGKDATKVDRSAAYAARHIACEVIRKELATRCEIQLSYCIGKAQPTSIRVETDGDEKEILSFIESFDLTPNGIITQLDLKKPVFQQTASYGHFGRGFSWD